VGSILISNYQNTPLYSKEHVPGEMGMLDKWIKEESKKFKQIDVTKYYHEIQIRDFLKGISLNRRVCIDIFFYWIPGRISYTQTEAVPQAL